MSETNNDRSFWGIRNFDSNLKNAFKAKCGLEKITMMSKLEELISNYVYNLGDGVGELKLSSEEKMMLIKIVEKL